MDLVDIEALTRDIADRTGNNIIVRVCSSCSKYLGIKAGMGSNGVTHSLCPACAAEAKLSAMHWRVKECSK